MKNVMKNQAVLLDDLYLSLNNTICPKKFNDKHFSVQKKVNRLQQLVNRFVQKLTVYSNW